MKNLLLGSLFFYLLFNACSMPASPDRKPVEYSDREAGPSAPTAKPVVIDIIPFNDMPAGLTEYIFQKLTKIYSNVKLQRSIPLPQSAYYAARSRYRGDSLIRQLAAQTPAGHVTLALTTRDISTTNGKYADWGVMGISYCPGEACVASSHRLKKGNLSEQFFKVAIHELGHTQGLGHCPVKSCYMRDAEGKNTTDEEKEFCPHCRKLLLKAGWLI